MMLGKLLVPGILLIWIIVGQGPTALAVGAGGGYLDIFFFRLSFLSFSPSLWEMARFVKPKTTNQPAVNNYIYHNCAKNESLVLLCNLASKRCRLKSKQCSP